MTLVDDYLNSVREPQKTELQRVRTILATTVPDLEETISYGMPAFKYKGKYFLGFSAFKDHMSVFPGSEAIELLKDKLQTYTTAKGTVQFTVTHPLDKTLLVELAKICKSRIDTT